MSTNKIALRSVEEFMGGYSPVYNPLYPLFLAKGLQHTQEVGKREMRRVSAVGDIRAKHITPKDTEISQIAVMEGKKAFKKYFLANQFILSQFQDREGVEETVAQVLDEHQLHQDELFLLGEGTAANNVVNNGLYWSADPFYTLESSDEVPTSDRLNVLHSSIMATAEAANAAAGQKVVILYGATMATEANKLHTSSGRAFKAALAEALGAGYSVATMPSAATPTSANGWIVANLDQTKLHYTALPQLRNQGINEEKMYYWSNFLMGSMMLEVLARYGVIRQPVTFAT